ncbi:MAG: hypothetical protein ABIC40_00435 [bacterium]
MTTNSFIKRGEYLFEVNIVERYFSDVASTGKEVLSPTILYKSVSKFSNPQELVWSVKSGKETVEYFWQFYAIPRDLIYKHDEHGSFVKFWWSDWCQEDYRMEGEQLKSVLIPVNEPALEVHKELGLPLPPDFSLDKLAELDGNYDPFAGDISE